MSDSPATTEGRKRAALRVPIRATISSTGRFFPARCVDNRFFYEELGLETNEEWIRSRTGIRQRRFVDPTAGETASTMAIRAAERCLEKRGIGASEIDAIAVATVTPDMGFPATACVVQGAIGAHNAWAYDVEAACSGFLYSLSTAAMMIESGRYQRVLVIGTEAMSRILDFTDRTTCVLFGDGAGAVLVEPAPPGRAGGFVDWALHADGSGVPHLFRTGGGTLHEYPQEGTPLHKREWVYQEGKPVFRAAVRHITEVIGELLDRNGLAPSDIDRFVPHQANTRILEAVRSKLAVPADRMVVTIDRYANTTSASIPTALDIATEEDRVQRGDRVVMCAFGGGFTWGATLVEWT